MHSWRQYQGYILEIHCIEMGNTFFSELPLIKSTWAKKDFCYFNPCVNSNFPAAEQFSHSQFGNPECGDFLNSCFRNSCHLFCRLSSFLSFILFFFTPAPSAKKASLPPSNFDRKWMHLFSWEGSVQLARLFLVCEPICLKASFIQATGEKEKNRGKNFGNQL